MLNAMPRNWNRPIKRLFYLNCCAIWINVFYCRVFSYMSLFVLLALGRILSLVLFLSHMHFPLSWALNRSRNFICIGNNSKCKYSFKTYFRMYYKHFHFIFYYMVALCFICECMWVWRYVHRLFHFSQCFVWSVKSFHLSLSLSISLAFSFVDAVCYIFLLLLLLFGSKPELTKYFMWSAL